MGGRLRNVAANILVAIAVFIVAWWFLRGVLRMIVGLATLGAVIAVVVVLLAAARRMRKR